MKFRWMLGILMVAFPMAIGVLSANYATSNMSRSGDGPEMMFAVGGFSKGSGAFCPYLSGAAVKGECPRTGATKPDAVAEIKQRCPYSGKLTTPESGNGEGEPAGRKPVERVVDRSRHV